jgi:hypothetical protein
MRDEGMNGPASKGSRWNTLALVFYGATWFYLLLYFSGVLDVKRYGGVYALALLAATLIAALTSPYRAAPRWHAVPAPGTSPRPPRVAAYAAMAAVGFLVLWLGLRLLEWISVSLTGSSRWPVSSLTGLLTVAAVALVGTALFGLLHLRAYRKLRGSSD